METQLKNIISFTLGEDTEETRQGAMRNAELVSLTFPGWEANFYLPQSIDEAVASSIGSHDNCNVFLVSDEVKAKPCYWRYFPLSNTDSVSSVIVRDVKNTLNDHDFNMVSEWIESPYQFHCIKNFEEKESLIVYPYHWGVKIHGPINTNWLLNYLAKEDLFNERDDYHEDMMLFSFHQGFHFLFVEHILPELENS